MQWRSTSSNRYSAERATNGRDPEKRFPHTREIADRLNRIRNQMTEIYSAPEEGQPVVTDVPPVAAAPVLEKPFTADSLFAAIERLSILTSRTAIE